MSHSSEIRQVPRFRTNPIEVAFLSVISLVFINSVYSLIYDHPGFQAAALTPMASHPTSEGRTLASVNSSLLNLNFDCDKTLPETTSATRVRILGLICGFNPDISNEKSMVSHDRSFAPNIAVKNKTNQSAATVFTDRVAGKFSTDYISLDVGENIIQVEIRLGTGKTISREISIHKS